MRPEFFKQLYEHMKKDKRIIALTGDLGYGGFTKIREDFPDRFINCGASEQLMMGIAVGLALEGKIPVVYSITTFLLRRPFETISLYIDHEEIPVKLIGSGRRLDYEHDGFSHHATDDHKIMGVFMKIQAWWPHRKEDIPALLDSVLYNPYPVYINLSKKL